MIDHGPSTKLRVRQVVAEEVHLDLVRVHQEHRPGTRAGDVIVISVGSKDAVAVARGARDDERDTIAMDQQVRRRLGVEREQEYEFRFSKAGSFDALRWAWHATEAMPRVAARLAVVSVGLGLLGLLLGFVSLVT